MIKKIDDICFIIFILCSVMLISCRNDKIKTDPGKVNLSHLKHLYAAKTMNNGAEIGIIHIYSEYPDYDYEIETDEGFTCVDDVARAVVLLSMMPDLENDPELMEMMKGMTEFILQMQAENGYFYNFLEDEMQINTTYRTSLPEPNWWSWRAFWALESAREHLAGIPEITSAIDTATRLLAQNISDEYLDQPYHYDTISGYRLPSWLPLKHASDQAAVIILALEKYHKRTQDPNALLIIERFAKGIMAMQIGNINTFPYGAFMSWKNLWHAYGNLQSFAMLKAAKLLNNEKWRQSALLEIDWFYSYLINSYFLDHIYFIKDSTGFIVESSSQYPQIAYGIRPMVFACLEVYDQTGDLYYLDLAKNLASWFAGNNPAGKQMYDEKTGRCFDGIISEQEINMNSGAESTIEALLTLQAIENHRKIIKTEE